LNLTGLEYACDPRRTFLEAAGISEGLIREVVDGWGANVIRLPFNQDRVLRGTATHTADHYLSSLDRVVAWAAAAGAYTVLDLQWLDSTSLYGRLRDGTPNRVPPLPNPDSVNLWASLADRYRDEPSVIFDIFNEPHDPIQDPHWPEHDDRMPLIGAGQDGGFVELAGRRVTMKDWQAWARLLVRTIRVRHPRALIVVPGIGWGYDLRGMPLRVAPGSPEEFGNLVYSSHVYPWSGCGRTPGTARFGRWWDWRTAFGRLARRVPVFIGEWGGSDLDVAWGRGLARYMDRLGVGWAAWSWADRPRLVQVDATGERRPTQFGAFVRASLSGRSGEAAIRSA
jgi:aryl-phospho-beta-D-glucosidase BglC (GH1 family)